MSLLDKFLNALPASDKPTRLMGTRILGFAPLLSRMTGQQDGDVPHVIAGLLQMVDLRRALESHVELADVHAVNAQLLAEKPCYPEAEEPPLPVPLAPRMEALVKLAGTDLSAVSVLRATAASLPRELGFLRGPLEAAAASVGPRFDGALAMTKEGALSLVAWEDEPAAAVASTDGFSERHPGWFLPPSQIMFGVLRLKSIGRSLEARGLRKEQIWGEDEEAPVSRNDDRVTVRRLKKGATGLLAWSPATLAVILRTERYAAEDASDVKLRHLLAALHDEPDLAPVVARLAG